MLRVAVRKDLVRFSPSRSYVHNQDENELPDYEVGVPWVSATHRGSNQTAYSVLEVLVWHLYTCLFNPVNGNRHVNLIMYYSILLYPPLRKSYHIL